MTVKPNNPMNKFEYCGKLITIDLVIYIKVSKSFIKMEWQCQKPR